MDSRSIDNRSNDSRARDPRMDPHSDTNSEYERIMELANDVNNSLEVLEENEKRKRRKKQREVDTDSESVDSIRSTGSKDKKTKKTSDETEDDHTDSNESDNKQDPIANIMQNGYGMIIIEPLLLLTIYVILSQPFAISFASHYIDQLNPNEDSSIPLSGIIIYGVILVIMFLVLRKVVEWKLDQ